jgi:protein-S-isoprenylcysteine O-methyltransferase Ste14
LRNAVFESDMRATRWEFENRAWIFGAIFGVSFFLSSIDRRNAAVAIAEPIAARLRLDGDAVVRAIFAAGALVAALGAATRTWASAYLAADVVYAEKLQTASLVADGPYRFVRNPLYLGNVLLAIGMGTMASRFGFALMNVSMLLFSYRLILREEGELAEAQGAGYHAYCARVPRLFPSPAPRIPSAGRAPRWTKAFLAESWYWGFALAVAVFAATLSVELFFAILVASIALLFIVTSRAN